MDTPITRAEHEEFRRRMEDENKRQDARLEALEASVKEIQSLANSVASLAGSMERMTKEQEKQGKILVIRPKEKLQIGKIEKDPANIKKIYEQGRETVLPLIPEIQKFLEA